MLWALGFFVVAALAALLGFAVAAVTFAAAAKLVFYVAVVLCAVSLASILIHRILDHHLRW